MATAERELGPAEILVNNVVIARAQAIEEITERDWNELIAVNLKSCFLVTQGVLPGLRPRHWGRIVNVPSVAAAVGGIVVDDAVLKAGMLGITRYYASDMGHGGTQLHALPRLNCNPRR